MHFFSLINSSIIPCSGDFTSDGIRKAEEAPEDPAALGIKEQAYLWQMLLLEAGGDTA